MNYISSISIIKSIMSKIIGKSFLTIIIFFLFCVFIFAESKIKYPNVSGQFYPSHKDSLSSQIDSFFNNVKQDPGLANKDILAIISPHAGYIYSGQVAAYGFKAIKGKSFDTVIIVAASHHYPFSGISVYAEGFFRTPLGDIKIDGELAQKLISSNKKITYTPEVFNKEHSLEVELPFLQKSLTNFKIVPIILGQIDYTDSIMLARAIIETSKGRNILLVASTDLSHYHPYSEAERLDSTTISYMKNLDALGLWQAKSKNEAELCGSDAVSVLLNYARELGLSAEVLHYANSGDVTGDKSGVVGYVSVIFTKNKSNNLGKEEENKEGEEAMFNEAQKKRLLEIARQTITEYISNRKKPDLKETDPQLNLKRGAFVTLHKAGNLRGCIGTFTSNEPLFEVISKMAIESATGDPRFQPVAKEELKDIDIEISVLTEPQLINDWRKVKLGIDGVIIRKGFSSGVFLPQVATETGWDLGTFLSQLCAHKAGLSPEAYKDPSTQIYTFQAIIFSEKE